MNDLDQLLGSDREQLVAALAHRFPMADRLQSHAGVAAMPLRGGRRAAETRLTAIDPVAYARSRNDVSGRVTGLSPWIRHGVVTITDLRDRALAVVRRPDDAAKLVAELGWRDYWQQVYAAIADRIHDDIEPPAALPRTGRRLDRVPDDVLAATTGMRCIDAFVRRLHETGWLHNHERMWLASWLVHVRRVRWQAGADWFLEHLLDADPASNHLSWQWVAGTFSAKPYIFNRENLETFTANAHCGTCPLLGTCDVEGDYDDLAARLFQPGGHAHREPLRIRPAPPWRPAGDTAAGRPLVWLTLDSLSATSPAPRAHPDAPLVFVIDPAWLAAERPTLKRLVFIFECLAEIPDVEIHQGDPAEVLAAQASRHGCGHVVVADTPCPQVRRSAEKLSAVLPVRVAAWPRFCDHSRLRDLGRFSRYWSKVSATALTPTG